MSKIQDLTPRLDAFSARVRDAKMDQRLTIEQLGDLSGVSTSTISKITSGVQVDPKLSNAAALCAALDLSMDELLGLDKPTGSAADLQQQLHAAELQNAQLTGEVQRLQTVTDMQAADMSAFRSTAYVLGAISLVLAFLLTGYLVGDAQYPHIGLVRDGALSPLGWVMVVIICVSVVSAAVLVSRAIRRGREK